MGGHFNMTVYTNIAKPTLPSYTRVNSIGKEQYDQIDITYDNSTTFYDGINQSLYTKVNKTATSLIDSYSESNADNTATLRVGGGVGARTGFSQSFTGVSMLLSSCKFWMKITGSPTGSAYAYLYAHSGSFGTFSVPTGSPLATSDSFDVRTLTTSSALTEFLFSGSNQYQMSATKYCIAVKYEDVSGDGTNNIQVGIDTSSPTHAGNQAALVPSTGIWGAIGSQDVIFYVYGKGTSYTNVSKPS